MSNSVFHAVTCSDSAADDNFQDVSLASQAGISNIPLNSPIAVNALDGRFLAWVTHHTVPLLLVLSIMSISSLT